MTLEQDIESKAVRQALSHDAAHRVSEAVDVLFPLAQVSALGTQSRYRLVRWLLELSEHAKAADVCDAPTIGGAESFTLAAKSHFCLSQYDALGALQYAEKAWRVGPDFPESGYALHSALLLSGRELDARKLLAQLVNRFPNHAEIQVEYATRAELSVQEQLEGLRRLGEQFPHARVVPFVKITVLSALHQLMDATKTFQWLFSKLPGSHELLGLGALLNLQKGETTQAQHFAVAAVERSAYAFLGHLTQFHLSLLKGQTSDARTILEGVLEFTAGTINEMTYVPQMWLDLGERELSISLLKQLKAQNPDSPEVDLAMARLALESRDHAAALMSVTRTRECWPEHYEARVLEADIRYQAEDLEGAARLLDALAQSETVDLLKLKVRRLSGAEPQTLVADYEDFLARYPSFDYVWGTLLRYYLELDEVEHVNRLLNYPRAVPSYVRAAVSAYQCVLQHDIESAESHLGEFIQTRERSRQWQWCWELILETLDEPKLSHWLMPLSEAARTDGV